MKVKAFKVGYYAHKRRKEGEEFVLKAVKTKVEGKMKTILTPEQQFSEKWMEIIDADWSDDDESVENNADTKETSSEKFSKAGKPKGKPSVAAESEQPKMSA